MNTLPAGVREILADFQPSAIIEYLAEILGCDDGHRSLTFWLEGGILHHSEIGHRRITRDELNGLARSGA